MPPIWSQPATPNLRTDRLDLEPLAEAHAEAMLGVLGDPGLYAFIGGEPPDLRELRARFARMVVGHNHDGSQVWHNWIVRTRDTSAAVGTIQATVDLAARAAEIAWVIGVPWQGRGYASEAAVELVGWLERIGITEITAHIHPEHGASAAVAARAGLGQTESIEDGERVWRRVVRRAGGRVEGT